MEKGHGGRQLTDDALQTCSDSCRGACRLVYTLSRSRLYVEAGGIMHNRLTTLRHMNPWIYFINSSIFTTENSTWDACR